MLVSGPAVTLDAPVSDDVAVAQVQSIIDCAENIGPPINSGHIDYLGQHHRLRRARYAYAVARDTSGNYGTSSIKIIVKNGVQH